MKLPIDFKEKVTNPPSPSGKGYPFRISAFDLMRNFSYAALDANEGWIEDNTEGMYEGRKLKLPEIPTSGTHVLGCIDGEIQWIGTESC